MTFQPSGKHLDETWVQYHARRFDEIVAENIRQESEIVKLRYDALHLRRDQGPPQKDC